MTIAACGDRRPIPWLHTLVFDHTGLAEEDRAKIVGLNTAGLLGLTVE